VFDKLEEVKGRYDELNSQLADPSITSDPAQFRKVAKEQAHLQEVVDTYDKFRAAEQELAENKSLLGDDDEAIQEMAKEEINRLEAEIEKFAEQLKTLLIPKDPMDEKNIVLEVRAGTGGDEAALFAADLFRMYARYAETKGWKLDIVSSNETDLGGFREVIALIEGNNVYSALKYEAGTHRVQRVPDTETQGRIHTSAVTVAVLPEVEDVDVHIDNQDLRIDTFRASGAGGQHVNKTESAIRITHEPTGLVVSCQDEKSQHKNKAKALKVLKSRLYEMERSAQQAEIADERLSQVGSGDRSERIRTYNFPQNRLSDHRINLTLYQLDTIINGDLGSVVEPLQLHEQAEKLKQLEAT
jgi:peptide chain release factor 1